MKKINLITGQTAIVFILPFLIFMFFVVFLSINMATTSAENPSLFIINSTNYTYVNQSSIVASGGQAIKPPVCDLSGWGLLTNIFGLKCVADYVGLFIGLAFVSTEFAILNILIFAPLGLALIFVILEVIRG